MGVLHHVRRGIGATRTLDYAPAVAAEIRAIEGEGGQPEATEADSIAAEADIHDTLAEIREPTCAEECGRWGDQEVGKMIREYRAGLGILDIAATLGESVQAVAYELAHIYRDMQVRKGAFATRGKRLTTEQLASIDRMYGVEHKRMRDIAKALGIAESTVRYVVEQE